MTSSLPNPKLMNRWLTALLLALSPLAAGGAEPTGRAQATTQPSGAVGIGHVALRAANVEQSLEFYRDVLGFSERFRTNKVAGGPNVYYRRGATPEDVEKEKRGTLLLVDLKINERQTLELFAGRNSDQPVFHHVAMQVGNLDAIREKLETLGVTVPALPKSGEKPLGSFFARDPNGFDVEVVRRAGSKATTAASRPAPRIIDRMSRVDLPISDLAASQRFYGQTLGLVRSERPTDPRTSVLRLVIPDSGDLLDLRLQSDAPPSLCLDVGDIERFLGELEKKPWRANYARPIAIYLDDNQQRAVDLFDPDGFRVTIREDKHAQ